MADYSNLFKGGGVSSPGRKPGGQGGKMLFTFVALCIVVIFVVWGISAKLGDKENVPVNEAVAENENQKHLLPEIKSVNVKTSPVPVRTSSLSPKKLAQAKADFSKALTAFAKDDFVVARDAARLVVNSGLDKNEKLWNRAAEIMGKANIGIYMSDVPAPEKKLYTIKEGDNLITIAKRFKTTVESIQKSNGLNPANPIIFPGKTLYIYIGEWSVKISKTQFRLYLYDRDKLFKIYKVGIGRQGRTPTGTFKITTKQKEPVWYNEGRAIQYGDKKNVLGTRWMAIMPTGKTDTNLRGYGIHGTWKPETIGTESSNGCIRMKNEEVDELYSILPYYTEVTIKD